MRKVKKINGYLVVRFNEREKQGYPQLGSFGVIDAEMYTGCIDTDLGAMEYEDADTLEVAVEQARGLESEQDYSGDPPVCTLIVEAADETTEEEVDPQLMIAGFENSLQEQAAQIIADNQLNVRQAEALCKKLAKPAKEPREPQPRGTLPVEVEESLKQVLGSEVNVAYHDGKGKLTVHFYSDKQLRAFANLLGQYQNEE